jgi:hypothetical protein
MIVPDVIEPIVGWRYWTLFDGRLASPFKFDEPWLPRERKEAKCRLNEWPSMFGGLLKSRNGAEKEHQAPLEGCGCGIHAAKDLETLHVLPIPGEVVGEVYLWGKVIHGEYAYRVQYAYPKSLRLVTNNALEVELEPLRAYCADVGVMNPSAAWIWPEEAPGGTRWWGGATQDDFGRRGGHLLSR